MAWIVACFCNRTACSDSKAMSDLESPRSPDDPTLNDKAKGTSLNGIAGKQHVHVWSAYNSLVQPPPAAASHAVGVVVVGVDKAFGLPIINAAAHEWTTLVKALDQLTRLNELVSGTGHKLVATLDMDLYKRALKLEYIDPQFKNKWLLCPVHFRCLGRTIESSGLDKAWHEADTSNSVTVTQIINGNHHNMTIEAH